MSNNKTPVAHVEQHHWTRNTGEGGREGGRERVRERERETHTHTESVRFVLDESCILRGATIIIRFALALQLVFPKLLHAPALALQAS